MRYKPLFSLILSLVVLAGCSDDFPTPSGYLVNLDVTGHDITVSVFYDGEPATDLGLELTAGVCEEEEEEEEEHEGEHSEKVAGHGCEHVGVNETDAGVWTGDTHGLEDGLVVFVVLFEGVEGPEEHQFPILIGGHVEEPPPVEEPDDGHDDH